MNSALLRERFAIPDHVSIQDIAPDYPVLDIRNPHATARIAVHGAQVLSFQPEGEEDLLWVSKTAVFAEGTSVRGGIPICWPWFGRHPKKDMPSHGFARNRFWTLCAVEQQDDGRTVVTLSLEDDAQSRAIWPHAFQLQLQVSVGRSLSLALTMRNKAAETVDLTMALHTYFSTGDIAQTAVRGLEGRVYIDALRDWRRFTQAGDVRGGLFYLGLSQCGQPTEGAALPPRVGAGTEGDGDDGGRAVSSRSRPADLRERAYRLGAG
ncbi:D-hexose-6-phosphate mutarotase [Congregibacter litoralis]|uniref:glucose-6-phosphate 1-epimerase n=1 Tax=Congregibacter litoralis KT71 TaxID=314285 RepID=A4AAV4_9GAMM|nr:D-hexose-6-phosphate mutarotase [Congregibacter litoralis]EAQ96826.1 putative enzyme [Congregibacter litoralis KT71]